MQCTYCHHESEPGDQVRLYEQGIRFKKDVPVCENMIRCLERQLAQPPKRTERKILAGVR